MDRDLTSSQGTEAYPFLAAPLGADEIGRLAHFRVLRLLGRGGMGLVFHAEDTRLERPVALKVMRPEVIAIPEAAARFLREARATAAIKHGNVITIYEAGEDRGVPFLAMELLSGTSLQDWLKQGGSASIGQVVEISLGIALGLSAAHERGLVHRDIKPSNVWLEAPDGRVKILDFGLARVTQSDSGLTHIGTVIGTPQYMSPEQASGQSLDRRSDLFSLGCILYQLWTARLPFQGHTPVAVLRAIELETPLPVCELNPAVPARLAELIAQLLAKAPDDRPGSAAEVVKTLQAVKRELVTGDQSFAVGQSSLSGVTTPASGSTASFADECGPPSKTASRGKWRGRQSLLVAALLLIGTLLVVGIALRPAPVGGQWVYTDLEKEADSWKVYAEGKPKWECTELASPARGGQVLRLFLAGGAPYSNAHFYRNLPATASNAPKRFTLSLSFRFSQTTSNNQGGPSIIQALEFTVSEWHLDRRHELALQWLNVGPNAPCWRFWDPHNPERWRELAFSGMLEGDRWHSLRLEGVARGDQTLYQFFTLDGRTHDLGIAVPATAEPDQPDKVAVGVQLDGNSQQDPFEVHLDKVSLRIDSE
jgi:serine/threonine protein kinase